VAEQERMQALQGGEDRHRVFRFVAVSGPVGTACGLRPVLHSMTSIPIGNGRSGA